MGKYAQSRNVGTSHWVARQHILNTGELAPHPYAYPLCPPCLCGRFFDSLSRRE